MGDGCLELDVVKVRFGNCRSSLFQHRVRPINAYDLAFFTNHPGSNQAVYPGTTSDIYSQFK